MVQHRTAPYRDIWTYFAHSHGTEPFRWPALRTPRLFAARFVSLGFDVGTRSRHTFDSTKAKKFSTKNSPPVHDRIVLSSVLEWNLQQDTHRIVFEIGNSTVLTTYPAFQVQRTFFPRQDIYRKMGGRREVTSTQVGLLT